MASSLPVIPACGFGKGYQQGSTPQRRAALVEARREFDGADDA